MEENKKEMRSFKLDTSWDNNVAGLWGIGFLITFAVFKAFSDGISVGSLFKSLGTALVAACVVGVLYFLLWFARNSFNSITARHGLEKKVLYRSFKVIYLASFVISGLAVLGFAWTTMPESQIDDNKSAITCSNGSSYTPADNGIYIYGNELSSNNDKSARILCQYDTTDYYKYETRNIANNYTFEPVFVAPNYLPWLVAVSVAALAQAIFFFLVGTGFLYVLTGERPRLF